MKLDFSGLELELGIEERLEHDKDSNEIQSLISIIKTNDQLNAEVSY